MTKNGKLLEEAPPVRYNPHSSGPVKDLESALASGDPVKDFDELVSCLTQQELALLCQLNNIVGREMLLTHNIYRLLKEGLVRVCEPLLRKSGESSPYLHSYKLTERGGQLLDWLRSEGTRKSSVGA